jgi:50S ribosomal subunit-associated GTPase HflX
MISRRRNRIALIGNAQMGKTALFKFLKGEDFLHSYKPTDATDHFTLANSNPRFPDIPELNFWDLSGSPCNRDIAALFLHDIEIAVICTDSLSSLAIAQLDEWFGIVGRATVGDPPPAYVVVRTKCDLAVDDPFDFGDSLRTQRHCEVIRVSAYTGQGMDAFVGKLSEICHERRVRPPQRPMPIQEKEEEEVACRCK